MNGFYIQSFYCSIIIFMNVFLYVLFQALHRELNSCIALGVSAIQLYITFESLTKLKENFNISHRIVYLVINNK